MSLAWESVLRARRRGIPKPPLCKGGPVLAAKQVPLGCIAPHAAAAPRHKASLVQREVSRPLAVTQAVEKACHCEPVRRLAWQSADWRGNPHPRARRRVPLPPSVWEVSTRSVDGGGDKRKTGGVEPRPYAPPTGRTPTNAKKENRLAAVLSCFREKL